MRSTDATFDFEKTKQIKGAPKNESNMASVNIMGTSTLEFKKHKPLIF